MINAGTLTQDDTLDMQLTLQSIPNSLESLPQTVSLLGDDKAYLNR